MTGLLGIPLGARGSARARYGRAMRLWADGTLSPAQLEAYRVAAADDRRPPSEVLLDRGLPIPGDAALTPESLIRALVDDSDRYLVGLPGPHSNIGVAEVRHGLARWRDGGVTLAPPKENAVIAAHLPAALECLEAQHPALAGSIAAAAPVLNWITYDGYDRALIGADFAQGHAYCSLIGEDAHIPARDYDFGLFLIAPHVLYRDHAHPAPELYAPLTGPHGWRFGPDRPLVLKPAHLPVWNPPLTPHLTKVGPVPFLCLFGWTKDAMAPAHVIPATDWPELEALRLG